MTNDGSNDVQPGVVNESADSLPQTLELPDVPHLKNVEKPATHISPLPEAPQFKKAEHIRRDSPTVQSKQTATSIMIFSTATTVAFPIIVFPIGGLWLDQHYHHPVAYLALIGLALGVGSSAAGINSLLKRLK